MKLFDRNLVEWKDMKNIKAILTDIKHYIETCNIT